MYTERRVFVCYSVLYVFAIDEKVKDIELSFEKLSKNRNECL
jgi:hypothetical protein